MLSYHESCESLVQPQESRQIAVLHDQSTPGFDLRSATDDLNRVGNHARMMFPHCSVLPESLNLPVLVLFISSEHAARITTWRPSSSSIPFTYEANSSNYAPKDGLVSLQAASSLRRASNWIQSTVVPSVQTLGGSYLGLRVVWFMIRIHKAHDG